MNVARAKFDGARQYRIQVHGLVIGMDTAPLESAESETVRNRPALFTLGVILFFVALGLADRSVGLHGQLVLGGVTWLVLLAALRPLSTERRLQTLLVVVVATGMEVVGSILWGVYTYRLHNLPLFVPPGHGLVYLGGISLSRTAIVRARPQLFVRAVASCAVLWALAGLTLLPRLDVGGAIGVAVFLFFLLRGRAPTIYGGVFVVVLFLEIWGTAIGLWQWHAVTPGLGLAMGNPPSGAMSGYVLFDIVALAVTARLLRRRAPVATNAPAFAVLRRPEP
jgi:hypothetical protein